ncbi:Platelet-activating factor acetylhydrolase-like [Comamonadaceae bacterium]
MSRHPIRNVRRDFLKKGASLALVTWGGAAFADASRPARFSSEQGVEIRDLDWFDTQRQRAVPVRLYLPKTYDADTGEQARNPWPTVVFSHGIGGSRQGYSWFGQHLARHGIASLHLQHVGSDLTLWKGNVLGLIGRLQKAAQEREALERVNDLRFALDTLIASDLGQKLDARRIVAAGHSYGANTTLLAAGARVQRAGGVLDFADERICGAIVISAPPFYGEGDLKPILGHITIPSLHITATDDVIRIPGYFSGSEDRLKVFHATGGDQKWLAVYEGGSHSMFTDRNRSGGAELNPLVKQARQALILAFLRAVWDADHKALESWPLQHTTLLSHYSAPTAHSAPRG